MAFRGTSGTDAQKIFIWGTGVIANRLLNNGISAEVLGYIETHKRKDWFCGKRVFQYTEVSGDYDAIIVANKYADEVYKSAQKQRMDMEKMIFLYPPVYTDSEEKMEWAGRILGEKNFEIYCSGHGFYDKTFYMRDKERYTMLNKRDSLRIDEKDIWPVTADRFAAAGTVDSYFWQDLWAARLIHDNHPQEHFDIGSRLDGFIAHVLSYGIPVNTIDVRPFPAKVEGLNMVVGDATDMKQFQDGSIESLSALCSLEHFGLGRYGDSVDPEACFKCFSSMQKKMKKGGKLYISVPVGKERLQFNAHRIFYARTITESFSECRLLEYSCTADGKLEKNVSLEKYDDEILHRGDRFGLFYFEKI